MLWSGKFEIKTITFKMIVLLFIFICIGGFHACSLSGTGMPGDIRPAYGERWHDRQMWSTMCVLGFEPWSSETVAHALSLQSYFSSHVIQFSKRRNKKSIVYFGFAFWGNDMVAKYNPVHIRYNFFYKILERLWTVCFSLKSLTFQLFDLKFLSDFFSYLC